MITLEKKEHLLKVCKEFVDVSKIVEISELKGGHINESYLITMPEVEYTLQKINTHVFRSPYGMMHNIQEVTDFIRKKIVYTGLNPQRGVLNIVLTRYDQTLAIIEDEYWRCTQFINNATAYERLDDPEMFYEMGRIVGDFQGLLDGFHTRILEDTIPHFHDTAYRYDHFLQIVKLDSCDRVKEVKEEIAKIKNFSPCFSYINKLIEDKEIPRRVTHNDTKPSNVLFDSKTKKAICLIDLDTVMKGSILFDYGDALRGGASTANEDEKDLSKVTVDLRMVEAFTKGMLAEMKGIITPKEVANLFYAYALMTMELGMRFLDDYLDGDKYFKTSYPTHNLDRAKNQLKLFDEIIDKRKEIFDIINNIVIELGFDKEFRFVDKHPSGFSNDKFPTGFKG